MALRRIAPEAILGALESVFLFSRNVFRDSRIAVRDRIFLQVVISILRFRLNQFFGAWQGFNTQKNIADDLHKRFYHPAQEDIERHERKSLDDGTIDYSALKLKEQPRK